MSLRVLALIFVLVLVLIGGLQAQNEPAPQPQLKWAAIREPVYPQMARIAHIQGEVWVEMELDPAGNIVALRPSGHPILVQAAIESLKLSKPICQDCGTENAVFFVRFRFKMPEPSSSAGVPATQLN